MNRTGIVLEIKGNKAIIMTPNGEFVNISFRGKAPSIGEIYSGRISKYNNAIRHLAIVASITFILICVSAIKLYYTACASIIVSINPSIEITINRWDRIIKAIPLNDDGSKILSEIKINNKPLNNGLD